MKISPICVAGLKTASVALLGVLIWSSASAATFHTFVDDQAGFMAAVGTGTIVKTEDFSTATDMAPVAPSGGAADIWNGFTVQVFGTGTGDYGGSHYCADLGQSGCISWNGSTPRIPGLYGDFKEPTLGLSIKPDNQVIAGFSFDFVDWNDGGQRSDFSIIASDGTTTTVTGPTNPSGYQPQNFGVTLSAADIAAGLYITEIRWIGAASNSEVVGFYNFRTFTNPRLTSSVNPVPSLSVWAVVLLSMMVCGLACSGRMRDKRAG